MLGVVVLHYGREAEELTRQSVRMLQRNTTEEHTLRVLVNGGPEPENLEAPVLIAPRQPSLAAAYNLAVEGFPCDKIAFVHNDCFVPKGWNEEMSKIVEKGDVAFPRVKDDPNSPVPIVPENWPPSCCWMLQESLFRKIGGFDEQFLFCHFEDWDIWMRCIRAGAWLRRAKGVTVFHARGFTRALEGESANAALLTNRHIYHEKHGAVAPCVEG